MNETPDKLLAADEPPAVTVHTENGLSPFLILADQACNFVPCALGRLVIPESELERHIAWDIGIAAEPIVPGQTSKSIAPRREWCVSFYGKV
jgi:predicted N-formylglutamate amidohydrolase